MSKADNAGVVLNCLAHLKTIPWGESLARSQLGGLDWDVTDEQERDLSMNPMFPGGPKAKFGHVDSEALTLDVLAASSMLINGAIGKKLNLLKFAAKGSERSKVPHGADTTDIDKQKGSGIVEKKVKVEASSSDHDLQKIASQFNAQ